jgi:hypothetical protein
VKEVLEIGVLLDVAPDVEAFVHISELDDRYIPDARKLFKAGDVMDVKVLRPNDRGGIRASRRATGLPAGPRPYAYAAGGARASGAAHGELGRVPRRERPRPGGLSYHRGPGCSIDAVGAAHRSGLGQLCTDARWSGKVAGALLRSARSVTAALTVFMCCCRKVLLGRSPAPPAAPPMKAPPRPKVISF